MAGSKHDFRNVKRARKAFANAAIYRVLSQILGAAKYVLLVRIMTEHDYGVYSLFYSIPVVIGALLSLGIGNALLRFLPEYFAQHNFALARHFISWAMRLRLLTTSLFLLACLLFWERIAPIFEIAPYKDYFIIFVAIAVTHFQSRLLTLVLGANLMQQWSSGLATAFASFKLIGYLVAMYVGVSLYSILIADLIAYLLWYSCLRIVYQTRVARLAAGEKVTFPAEEKKRVIRYAAFYNFNDVGVVTLSSTADRLFIAAFMSPVAVGAYAFCTGLNVMIQKMMPLAFFSGVVEPLLFTLNYVTDREKIQGYYKFLVKITYLVQLPVFMFVAAVPEQIIRVIFGGKFIEYKYLLVAAFAFPVVYAFSRPLTIIAQLGERAGIILASKIFAGYNVVAALALIPSFGAYGALLATGSAQVFKNIFIWFFVRKVATFAGTGLFFVVQSTLWLLCWVTIQYITAGLGDYSSLAVAVVLVGLFGLIGIRLAAFDAGEKKLIFRIAGSRASTLLRASGLVPG